MRALRTASIASRPTSITASTKAPVLATPYSRNDTYAHRCTWPVELGHHRRRGHRSLHRPAFPPSGWNVSPLSSSPYDLIRTSRTDLMLGHGHPARARSARSAQASPRPRTCLASARLASSSAPHARALHCSSESDLLGAWRAGPGRSRRAGGPREGARRREAPELDRAAQVGRILRTDRETESRGWRS